MITKLIDAELTQRREKEAHEQAVRNAIQAKRDDFVRVMERIAASFNEREYRSFRRDDDHVNDDYCIFLHVDPEEGVMYWRRSMSVSESRSTIEQLFEMQRLNGREGGLLLETNDFAKNPNSMNLRATHPCSCSPGAGVRSRFDSSQKVYSSSNLEARVVAEGTTAEQIERIELCIVDRIKHLLDHNV